MKNGLSLLSPDTLIQPVIPVSILNTLSKINKNFTKDLLVSNIEKFFQQPIESHPVLNMF